jgi:hypothetical protein
VRARGGRIPNGEACVSFDADGRVILYDLYRTIRPTERCGSSTSANVVSLRAQTPRLPSGKLDAATVTIDRLGHLLPSSGVLSARRTW